MIEKILGAKERVGKSYTTLQINSVYSDFFLLLFIIVQRIIHFPSYFNVIMITAPKQYSKIICIISFIYPYHTKKLKLLANTIAPRQWTKIHA